MAGKTITVTEDNFQTTVLDAQLPVLVDFWAPWCGPCRMLAPTIEELANEYDGKAIIAKCDIDESRNTAIQFGISAIPTIIIFHQGQMTKKLVGLTQKKDLKAALDNLP